MAKRRTTEQGEDDATSTKTEISDEALPRDSQLKNDADADGDSKLIQFANAQSIDGFQRHYIDPDSMEFVSQRPDFKRKVVKMTLKTSSVMTENDFNACFGLIQSTSQAHYEASSFGWHPRRKRREMKEHDMRYLLVHRVNAATGNALTHPLPMLGFLSFMLTYDSTPSMPVLYIYEIHLDVSSRGVGLGAHLMLMAEDIARKVGVQKTMLTCFLSNAPARQFYVRRGYAPDACTPRDRVTRNKIIKVDYVIMSKDVPLGR